MVPLPLILKYRESSIYVEIGSNQNRAHIENVMHMESMTYIIDLKNYIHKLGSL